MVAISATTPVTWLIGTAMTERSAGPRPMQYWKCSAEWQIPRWVSIAPFGRPVVPDV